MNNMCAPLDNGELQNLFSVAVLVSRGQPVDILLDITKEIESEENDIEEKFMLIKCLIPQEKIPEEVFCRLTRLLSPTNTKISMPLKVEILKWMISAYSFLETFDGKFKYFYQFFSTLLNCDSLRPYVCYFMYLKTRKSRHVTNRHANVISKSIAIHGEEPCLLLLLKLYGVVSPKHFVRTRDIEECQPELGDYPMLLKSVHPSYELDCFMHDITEKSDNSTVSVPGSFPEMHKRIMALKHSNDVSEILNSEYRRSFLTLYDMKSTVIKVYDYVLTAAYLDLNSSKNLRRVLEIVQDIQHIFPGISDLTEKLILSWDKSTNTDEIIELLLYEPICCIDAFKNKMCHFRDILTKSDVSVKCELLNCLSRIYVNWVLMEKESDVLCDGKFCADDNSLADRQISHLDATLIDNLGVYIDSICRDIISQDYNPWLMNEIILHYNRVSLARSQQALSLKTLSIHFPTSPVFHLSLFSLSACTLEILCYTMRRLASEVKSMQKEENPCAESFNHRFQECKLSMKYVLLSTWCGNKDKFYSPLTKVICKLKEKCPNFENSFIFHEHPALLYTISSSHSGTLHDSNSEFDQERFEKYIKWLNKKNYPSMSTLLSMLNEYVVHSSDICNKI